MGIEKLFLVKPKNDGNQNVAKGNTDKKIRTIIPKTAQETLPYTALYKNGIVETENGSYARLFRLDDINFRTAGQEEQNALFSHICEMLNTMSGLNIQFSCLNRAISEEDFAEKHLLQMQSDNLNEYRTEANDILMSHIKNGNDIQSDKFVTISVRAENIDDATNQFARLNETIEDAFRNIGGATIHRLSAEEVIKVLYMTLHPFQVKLPEISLASMMYQGVKSKDIIAPSCISVYSDYIELDEAVSATVYMSVYPTSLSTELIADINDLPFHLLSSVHMTSIAQEKAAKLVSNRITNITSNIQSEQKKAYRKGYSGDLISPDMQRAREDAVELLDDIKSKNQRLFYVTVAVQVYAETKDELNERIKQVQTVGNKHLATITKLRYQQEAGLASTLPIGHNKIEARRLLTTEATGTLVPFSAQLLNQDGGLYYGMNAVSGTMILFNRLSSKNANGVILGTSGSGKSFSAKREMMSVFLGSDADIMVVDPDNEYTAMAQMLGGEVIQIGPGIKTYINPLDMDIRYGDEDNNVDPITLKSDFMISLCETVSGGRYGLSPVQKSVIDRCVRNVYKPYMEYMAKHPELTCDREKTPTLVDFYESLKSQPEPEAQNVALSLELYCTGSLDTFAHHTNVETNSRFTVYDISKIGTGLHELGLQVCLNDIWNHTIANKELGKNTWFYLDEFYLLCKHDSSAQFLQQIYKRARKWGGVPTGITQDVEDLLASQECRTILNNCDFVMMLNQSPIGRAELSNMYSISSALQRHITDQSFGHGLLYTGSSIIPFDDKYPKDTKSYQAMTTTMAELKERE